jgi:exosortase
MNIENTTSPVAASPALPRINPGIMAGCIVGAALLYLVLGLPYAAGYGAYRITLWQWLRMAWSDPTWQHGALAAPVAAFLAWRKRKELMQMEAKPMAAGLVLALLALATYWVGYRGNFYYIGYASIQLLVAGVILWIWGWRCFMMVSFAWLMLGFAWPYLFLEDTLAFRLRYIMVSSTTWILNHVGLETLQDGTSIISAATAEHARGERFSLNVDGPCSGMRSLFALLMVGALFGYFRQRSLWRRTLLIALSVPLAMVANMMRILILVGGSMAFGQTFAVGRGEEYTSNFHLLSGFAVFAIALAGLQLAMLVLNRWFGEEEQLKFTE